MAFEIARVHERISSAMDSSAPCSGFPGGFSPTLDNSFFSSSSSSFPSPRTWHATRANIFASPSPSFSPSLSPSPSPPLPFDSDSESDAGAEIAEWMAQSCIADDSYPPPGLSSEPIPNLRRLHAGSRSVSSVSRASSSDSSTGASPTSVLAASGGAAWDLLFAAAGEVQKLAREKDGAARAKGQPKNMQQLLLSHGQGLGGRHVVAEGAGKKGGAGRRSGAAGGAVGRQGGKQGRQGEGESAGVRAQGGRESGNGTGVFISRMAVAGERERERAGAGAAPKKERKQTTVLLPARLVQAFGLNVDQENNVVLGRSSANEAATGGRGGGSYPVMKLLPEESSVAANGGAAKRSGNPKAKSRGQLRGRSANSF